MKEKNSCREIRGKKTGNSQDNKELLANKVIYNALEKKKEIKIICVEIARNAFMFIYQFLLGALPCVPGISIELQQGFSLEMPAALQDGGKE